VLSDLSIVDYIITKFDNDAGKRAAKIAEQMLKMTGHVPVVTTIARGVGFCTYYARLTESIGAQSLEGHVIDRASGKGDDVHKILGLSSLRLFMENGNKADVKEIVEDASKELRDLSIIQNESKLEESKIEAQKMILNLFDKARLFEEITGMRLSDAVPIIEQQLVDYEVRMRGIPDLILESKSEEKAIVIDWKTSRETPRKYEAAQVVCYAILEARRLSCTKEEAVEKIAGILEGNKVTSVDILPVIIRADPELSLQPHPAFSKPEKIHDEYEEFKKIIRNTIVMAQHLTLLISNQNTLTMTRPDDTSGPVPWGGGKVNYVRLTPFDLGLFHGDPKTQTKYPCTACYLKEPCKFYFGRPYGEKEDYETTMWKLRYRVFEQKEKQLLPYLALYQISDLWSWNDIVDKINQGSGFAYPVGYQPYITRNHGRIAVKRSIKDKDKEKYDKRIDVLDEIRVDSKPPTLSMYAKRSIRKHEEEQGIVYVINERKPVFVAMPPYKPHKDLNFLLSINFFGRVDQVDVDYEKRVVKYEIGLPSRILKYQMLIFSKYVANDVFNNNNLIMVEVDVDLTRMELYSIDYLQRILENPEVESREDKLEAENEKEILKNIKSHNGVDADDNENFEEYLKKIIESAGKRHDLQN
jgi:hypothetical protein